MIVYSIHNHRYISFILIQFLFDVYGMDRRTPYTLSVLPPSEEVGEDSRTHIQARLREFVLEFQLDNAFIYRCVEVDEMWKN